MKTSIVALLAEIDILESATSKDANELEVVKAIDTLEKQLTMVRDALIGTVEGIDLYRNGGEYHNGRNTIYTILDKHAAAIEALDATKDAV